MKATINGIQLEGTPDEITDFVQKMNMNNYPTTYPIPYAPAIPIYPGPYWQIPPTVVPLQFRWNEVTCGSGSVDATSYPVTLWN